MSTKKKQAAVTAMILSPANDKGENPWKESKPATPAEKAKATKARKRAAAVSTVPVPDTATAEEQTKAQAKQSGTKRKPQANKPRGERKRGQGESMTEHVAGMGEVTVYPVDIALAGSAVKAYIADTLKPWEKAMKEGNDRVKGLKLPKWPGFSAMVEFLADGIKARMHVPSQGKSKPKGKGKSAPGNWRQARFAVIVWCRENKPLVRKEITERHARILAMQKSLLTELVKADRMDSGSVRVRTYKNTLGVSAAKKDKAGVA